MSELVVRAAYATVAEQDGTLFIGFVDARDENYVLFTRPLAGGPVVLEVNDEDFSAPDAIAGASADEDNLLITLLPARRGRFGYASRIAVRLKSCADAAPALARLAEIGVLPG